MKDNSDIGTLFVLFLVFGLIFMLVHFMFERLRAPAELDILAYALIASWAWLYWPRGENK